MRYFNRFKRKYGIAFFMMLCMASKAFAIEVPLDDFSLASYTQDIHVHIPFLSDADNTKALLTPAYQKAQRKQFYNHYYASDAKGLSPWSENRVKSVLPLVKAFEQEILEQFNNQNKMPTDLHYAENFKAHDERWFHAIKQNMDLPTFDASMFHAENKAIAVVNTLARVLPDLAPDFHHLTQAGEGFPFDNLQESAIWSGTPLYVLHVSQNKAWSLVLTPDDYFAWVKSSDIADASDEFIHRWQAAAQQNLMAITKTEVSILDAQQHFQLTGYIGAVFPLIQKNDQQTAILIPIKDDANQASIKTAYLPTEAATLMPLVASKENMIKILQELQNRPYGWGGSFFFNDCSQELKSLFTPFGIWLPRNSSDQGKLNSAVDLSDMPLDERLETLKSQGHPLMTLIILRGHVMLFVGNEEINGENVAMTYQNIWGLAPLSRDTRYVIGQSVFLPLMKEYAGYPDIDSLANKSMFKLVYLDALDTPIE